ncbi:MAG: hypothetical protein CMA72_08740, partial [Euryarchaeota archaeon]|nr:hypothetical protein [Euryarchaeota archaeon]
MPDALQAGELAVNLIDQKLFTADVDGNVFELGGTKVDSGGDPPATGENTGDLYWNGTNLLVWDGAAWEIVGPVVSVNGKDGTVVLDADDVGAATALQGATADSALQPGDDISELNNDAGYITAADVPDESLWKEDGDAVTPKAADADLKIEGSITAAGSVDVGVNTSTYQEGVRVLQGSGASGVTVYSPSTSGQKAFAIYDATKTGVEQFPLVITGDGSISAFAGITGANGNFTVGSAGNVVIKRDTSDPSKSLLRAGSDIGDPVFNVFADGSAQFKGDVAVGDSTTFRTIAAVIAALPEGIRTRFADALSAWETAGTLDLEDPTTLPADEELREAI